MEQNLVTRAFAHLYRKNRAWRRIALWLMKNRIRGSLENTTYLSHCHIDCEKGNHVLISPSDFCIRNLCIKVTGKGNKIIIAENFVTEGPLKIEIVGDDNKIELGEYLRVLSTKYPPARMPTKISIRGNRCVVLIGKQCKFDTAIISCRDDGSSIKIGEHLDSQRDLFIDSMEGRSIQIGNDVLLAYSVELRNNDGHSILDETEKRLNPSKDVLIGDRVWIGQGALILKSAVVPSDSVVAAHSVVTKTFDKSGVILAGTPAKIIKQNIHWISQRT